MELILESRLSVSYSQLAVFHSRIERPFNDWGKSHIKQGFSWREESVSFNTIIDSGKANLTVVLNGTVRFDCIRAISVPFFVPVAGDVEIASIDNSLTLKVTPGTYDLIFEIQNVDIYKDMVGIRLLFNDVSRPDAAILVADELLKPEFPLEMSARPA
jgi:Competence protein J (ComJ)